MEKKQYLLVIISLLSMFCSQLTAQEVTVCQAYSTKINDVDFTDRDCYKTEFRDLELNNGPVWIEFATSLPRVELVNNRPVGLFVSGWMSAAVYLDRQLLGSKGKPAIQMQHEQPGPFDWVGFVSHSYSLNQQDKSQYIKAPEQEATYVKVQMLLSNFYYHGKRSHPFNNFYFAEYQSAQQKQFDNYILSIIPLGVMLVSLITLVGQKCLHRFRNHSQTPIGNTYLLLMTVVATTQLLIEISRGLYAYVYYLHDYRLMAISWLAMLFGHLILLHTTQSLATRKRVVLVLASLATMIFVHTFLIKLDQDLRATTSIQIPALFAAITIFFMYRKKRTRLMLSGWILLLFCFVILVFPNEFLDVYLYYSIAGLLVFELIYQSHLQSMLQIKLNKEQGRANKLRLALDLKTTKTSSATITLKDSGKLIVSSIDDILFCKGAGDYVEVIRKKDSILHSGNLNELAKAFPASFIKVHRSYLVNAKHINSLERLSSGTGEITLYNHYKIPVSRRLLPTLKKSLSE